jgi:hypothetical protein
MHEIGHNLGGAHEDEGAMNSSATQTTQMGITVNNSVGTSKSTIKNMPTKDNVEKIVGTIWGGGRASGRPGQVKKLSK